MNDVKEFQSSRDGNVILELQDVTKVFGSHTAVDALNLQVHAGEVVAILGPNGAGKTTTVEMCEGFQQPSSGHVRVFGLDPYAHSDDVRRRIGVMLQGGGAYPGIRVGEMLRLVASYSKNPHDPAWLLELVGLERHVNTPYRRVSGGQQQRLSLACALVGRPELVFLDEPTAGLDAQSRITVWELISAMRRDGVAIALTTHLMDEAEELADHVVIIDKGSVVAAGTPEQIMTGSTGGTVATAESENSTVFAVDRPLDVDGLSDKLSWASISEVKPLNYELHAQRNITPDDVAELTRLLADASVLMRSFSVDRKSLEDVFLSLTGREIRR